MDWFDTEKKKLRARYGDRALVTGASSGIGLAMAEQLAGIGFDLVLVANDEAKLNELKDKWQSDYRIKVKVMATDLSVNENVLDVIAQMECCPIGLLVFADNNGSSGDFADLDIEGEIRLLRANGEAVLLLTYEFANRYRDSKTGGIIFFSSTMAYQRPAAQISPGGIHHAAIKSYVHTLAEGISQELKPSGVDVLVAVRDPDPDDPDPFNNPVTGTSEATGREAKKILRALGHKTLLMPTLRSKLLHLALQLVPH